MENNSLANFPIGSFPPSVETIISGAHRAHNYPVEFLGSSMLVAFASAMGNCFRLRVKGDWEECPTLYMALVGNAGSNKTHPMSFATRPLVALDLKRIEQASDTMTYTAPSRLVVSDVTQEGLVKLHNKNPRSLLLWMDELKAWVANFSRYTSGSQEQFWLSNFSHTPIIVDRKSEDKPLAISEPCISVLGSTQPAVLSSFTQGDKANNGFVDRMLFTILQGNCKSYWSDEECDPALTEKWRMMLTSVMLNEERYVIQYSAEALERARDWQRFNTDKINALDDPRLTGGYSKLEIYYVRFCLILHVMHYFAERDYPFEQIDADIAVKAMYLVEYYREQLHAAQEWLYPEMEGRANSKESQLFATIASRATRYSAIKTAEQMNIPKQTVYRWIKRWEKEGRIVVDENGDMEKL